MDIEKRDKTLNSLSVFAPSGKGVNFYLEKKDDPLGNRYKLLKLLSVFAHARAICQLLLSKSEVLLAQKMSTFT